MNIQELAAELRRVQSVGAIGDRAIETLLDELPCASVISYFPIGPRVHLGSDARGFSAYMPLEELQPLQLEQMEMTHAEIGPFTQVMAFPNRLRDFTYLGAELRKRRSRVYYEIWRFICAEKQVLAAMGSAEDTRGFVAVCRHKSMPDYTPEELAFLGQVRDLAEQAILRIERERALSGASVNDLLAALEDSLPIPAALFDADGGLVWLTDTAMERFQIPKRIIVRRQVIPTMPEGLLAWQALARHMACSGEGTSPPVPVRVTQENGLSRPVLAKRILPSGLRTPIILITEGTPHPVPPASEELHAVLAEELALTPRQAQISAMLAQGFTALNIAWRLGIREGTVTSHIKHIHRRLQVSNRAELTLCVATTLAQVGYALPSPSH